MVTTSATSSRATSTRASSSAPTGSPTTRGVASPAPSTSGLAVICLLLYLTKDDQSVLVNTGFAWAAVILGVAGIYSITSGWRMHVDEKQALVAAQQAIAFPVGHASAQQVWHGVRSRPTWRVLCYSAEDPPQKRGLVLVDAVDGSVSAAPRRSQSRRSGGRHHSSRPTRAAELGTEMFDGKFRAPVDAAVKPIGAALRKTKMTPDHLTLVGLLIAVAAAIAIGAGHITTGLILVILAALPDLLDGALAKASGAASQRGAFLDSTVDRVTDAFLLGGVAYYFATHEDPPAGRVAVRGVGIGVRDLVPACQGRVARAQRQGRVDGARRAHRAAVHRPVPRAVDRQRAGVGDVADAGVDHDHRRAALREGVEAGRSRTDHAGADRPSPGAAAPRARDKRRTRVPLRTRVPRRRRLT